MAPLLEPPLRERLCNPNLTRTTPAPSGSTEHGEKCLPALSQGDPPPPWQALPPSSTGGHVLRTMPPRTGSPRRRAEGSSVTECYVLFAWPCFFCASHAWVAGCLLPCSLYPFCDGMRSKDHPLRRYDPLSYKVNARCQCQVICQMGRPHRQLSLSRKSPPSAATF